MCYIFIFYLVVFDVDEDIIYKMWDIVLDYNNGY